MLFFSEQEVKKKEKKHKKVKIQFTVKLIHSGFLGVFLCFLFFLGNPGYKSCLHYHDDAHLSAFGRLYKGIQTFIVTEI